MCTPSPNKLNLGISVSFEMSALFYSYQFLAVWWIDAFGRAVSPCHPNTNKIEIFFSSFEQQVDKMSN